MGKLSTLLLFPILIAIVAVDLINIIDAHHLVVVVVVVVFRERIVVVVISSSSLLLLLFLF